MRTVGIRELARDTTKVLEEINRDGRPVLVTRRGEPIAVMTGIDHEVLEDFLLATAVREIADFEAAEEELASGATTAISDLLDPDKNTSKK